MPAPALPPAPVAAEYAYAVDVRPLDNCVVPRCSIQSRNVSGYTNEVENDGNLGMYARHGTADNEMFFRRSRMLHKGETFSFDVPESALESHLDFYLSHDKAGAYRVRMTVAAIRVGRPAELLIDKVYDGTTQPFVPRKKNEECAKIDLFEQHVRLPLPSRQGRMLRVTFENTTDDPNAIVALASPLVLKRVDGRGPRQAFVVVFDAVPFYLLSKLFTGTGDAPTEFVHKNIAERGLYFSKCYSPGMSTQLFTRRFFRNGYYKNDGEPILRGFGLDEDPPARSPTTIARLAEQGFRTEEFVGNFILNPNVTTLAVDGGYQNEFISINNWPVFYHPRVLASRFDAWISEHAHDDTWSVIWMTTTHDSVHLDMWGPNRPEVKAPLPPTITASTDYRAADVQARWENLLDSVDSFRAIFESANKHAKNASRLWFVAADHGLIQVNANQPRAGRYWDGVVPGGPQHRFFGSTEEIWTPCGVIYDGVARPPNGPQIIDVPTMSAAAAWRPVEKLFHVDTGAPETSSFDTAALSGVDAFQSRWDDGGQFSIGHGGGLRCAVGKWAYRSHNPKLDLTAIWGQPAHFQKMLRGTDRPARNFLAEELYDDEVDPLETRNVADEHPDIVFEMRKRTQDFYSTYHDPAHHPRHRHVLTFHQPIDLVIEGPRAFKLRVDDAETTVTMQNPRRAEVRGKKLEITEEDEVMSIISIKSAAITAPLLLRCPTSGQPLDEIGPNRDRLDLGVARHNCVVKSPEGANTTPPPGEIYFSFEMIRSKRGGVTSASGGKEALEAFRRWGYVRDLDPKH